MTNARAQINGVTYDLTWSYDSASITELAAEIKPKSNRFRVRRTGSGDSIREKPRCTVSTS